MGRKNLHFRLLKSRLFIEHKLPDEFVEFCDERILPHITLSGYKLAAKHALARQMLYMLVTTGLMGALVADSRSTATKGARLRMAVWDAIRRAGFARACRGSELAAKLTRYRARAKLLGVRRAWQLPVLADLHLARNTDMKQPTRHGLIYVHTGKTDLVTGQPLPIGARKQPISLRDYAVRQAERGPDGKADSRAVENGLEHYRKIEGIIETINRANLSHSWQAFHVDPETRREFVFAPDPRLRQVHIGQPGRAARLYGIGPMSGQNMPKVQRRGTLIGGEPVGELDFSGMHPRLGCHLAGYDPEGDVYKPEEVLPKFWAFRNATEEGKAAMRDVVKRVTNICLNVGSQEKAAGATAKLLRGHAEGKFVRRVVFQVEGSSPRDLVERIVAVHPVLADKFFTEYGMELMRVDGSIMLHILQQFVATEGKPALAVHDALVVRRSDIAAAEQVMCDVYRQFAGFEPIIHRTF